MGKNNNGWKRIRVLLLLLVLAFVAADQLYTRVRSTNWERTQWLVLYPVNADGSSASAEYIAGLKEEDFSSIEHFMNEEAERYGLPLQQPIAIKLGPVVNEAPPAPPPNGNPFEVAWWSLKFRYFSATHNDYHGPVNQQLYLNYYAPGKNKRLSHSVGLQKGLTGIVNVFADSRMRRQNHVIIAHEMLHLFGASDKYHPATNYPLYPIGFAEPDRAPLYPQRWAEIMGGRLPLSEQRADIPASLDQVLIGDATALEINWFSIRDD